MRFSGSWPLENRGSTGRGGREGGWQGKIVHSLQQTAQHTSLLENAGLGVGRAEFRPWLWAWGNSHVSCLGFSLYIHKGLLFKLTTW